MNFAHWFSALCPHFNPNELKGYYSKYGDVFPTEKILVDCGNPFAHHHFKKNESKYAILKSRISNYREKHQLSFYGDDDYPRKLNRLFRPPSVIFYKGNLSCLNDQTVGLVGARQPTGLGINWVEKFVEEILTRGEIPGPTITIVSGGARGIDSVAHNCAIGAKGKTAVWLPGGLDNLYPSSNHFLFQEVLRTCGLLITEFLPEATVRRESFLQRNRLIVGSSDVVVVVEAGLKSGTMMTARLAVEEGVELLVVPGSPLVPSYSGSLEMIHQGAGLARESGDVVQILQRKPFENGY